MTHTEDWITLGEAMYNGELKDGIPHGKGNMKWKSCIEYSGDFYEGFLCGTGIMKWPSGQMYEGQWSANVQEGKGIMHYPNGSIYEGSFHDGMRHGHGILRHPDKSYYEGIFCNNEMTADGTMYDSKGRSMSWTDYNTPKDQKTSIVMVIGKKTWRLLAALACFAASIGTGILVMDFFNGNGPSRISVKGLLAPVVLFIFGFFMLLSFFKHLFNKTND